MIALQQNCACVLRNKWANRVQRKMVKWFVICTLNISDMCWQQSQAMHMYDYPDTTNPWFSINYNQATFLVTAVKYLTNRSSRIAVVSNSAYIRSSTTGLCTAIGGHMGMFLQLCSISTCLSLSVYSVSLTWNFTVHVGFNVKLVSFWKKNVLEYIN